MKKQFTTLLALSTAAACMLTCTPITTSAEDSLEDLQTYDVLDSTDTLVREAWESRNNEDEMEADLYDSMSEGEIPFYEAEASSEPSELEQAAIANGMYKDTFAFGNHLCTLTNEEETEESAEQTEERTEADASGAVSAEKPKKGLWRERLIANAQLVEYGDKAAEIVDFAIIDHKGMITSSVDKNQRFRIKMKIKFHETMEHPIFAFSIKDRKGTEITGTNTALEDYTKDVVEAGKTVTVCFDQIMPLQSGQYLMSFGCTSYHLEELVIHHRLYDACFLEVFSMKDTVGFFDMNSTVTYE